MKTKKLSFDERDNIINWIILWEIKFDNDTDRRSLMHTIFDQLKWNSMDDMINVNNIYKLHKNWEWKEKMIESLI